MILWGKTQRKYKGNPAKMNLGVNCKGNAKDKPAGNEFRVKYKGNTKENAAEMI